MAKTYLMIYFQAQKWFSSSIIFVTRQETNGQRLTCPGCRTILNKKRVSVNLLILHASHWFNWKYKSNIEDKMVVPSQPSAPYFQQKKKTLWRGRWSHRRKKKQIWPTSVFLINFCILNRSLPSEWKQAHLTLVFKRGVYTDKANYRPVSILTSLSKVFDEVMYDQTRNAFHNVLSSNLSGFMKTHSCCTALLKMTEDWRDSIDNKEAVAAVAVDLSKAFDTINHSLLLAKLKAYGFSTQALELMST